MSSFRRFLTCSISVLALAAWPSAGAQAASINVAVKVKVTKPLVLSVKQDLDFGQIILARTAGTRTVAIGTTGTLSCGVGLTCTGAARQAIFNVTGSRGEVARISTVASNLTNATGGTILFTPVAPASVTFTNSGNNGIDFGVGGSISLTATTADGIYSGMLEVTVDYQ